MYFMLPLLIISSINAVTPIAVRKSEEVKAILYEYNHSPILRLKQLFILHGNVTVQIELHMNEINFLNIECRKKGDKEFHMFDTLDFKNCKARKRFYCVQDKNTYLIYFNTTTTVEFNQSEWRMNGYYNGYEFSSNAVTIPIVQPNVEASLFKFNQSYSKCEKDILENEEIVLEGHVRFYGDFKEDEMYITIELNSATSVNYILYDTVFLNVRETSNFKCTRDEDLNSYKTTLALKATEDLSESHWRLAGQFKGTPYYSIPVQLPRIIELSKILMRLNGQTLSQSNTSLTIKEDEELTLCCYIAPSPCQAVITVNHTKSFSNLSCVSHRPIKSHKSIYNFGYIVCGDNKYSQVLPVDVNIDAVKDTTDGVSLGIILSAVFGTFGFIVIFLIYFYYFRKEKNQEQILPVRESLLSPPQDNTPSPVESDSQSKEKNKPIKHSIIFEAEIEDDSQSKGKDKPINFRHSFGFEAEIEDDSQSKEKNKSIIHSIIFEAEIEKISPAATAKDDKKNQ